MGLKATTLVPRCCLVSQSRRRIVVGGYDLDMFYITDRILTMSFPLELKKAMYQDPMMQVKEVLERKHGGHYKVYNLCIDQDNDSSYFKTPVERYPFDDNHAPSLQMVNEFCESVHSWLSSDRKNVIFIHCKAGKDRIGLMVSSYLVYKGMLVEEALQLYADKGTRNNIGVMKPSQRRYVNYWQKCLSVSDGCPPKVNLPKPSTRELRRIQLSDTKNIESIFFVVSEMQEVPGQRYRSPADSCRNFCRKIRNGGLGEIEEDEEAQSYLDCNFRETVQVTGDVCATFYEKKIGGRLFYACFNTAFIENNSIQFSIMELDKVGNKGRSIAGPEFRVEFFFGPANPNPNDS
ncbi:hypothetical protein L1887_31718 [Cichorium endivia]|nr:hypothetical protein L1887_31718 [Cichorium endivia]